MVNGAWYGESISTWHCPHSGNTSRINLTLPWSLWHVNTPALSDCYQIMHVGGPEERDSHIHEEIKPSTSPDRDGSLVAQQVYYLATRGHGQVPGARGQQWFPVAAMIATPIVLAVFYPSLPKPVPRVVWGDTWHRLCYTNDITSQLFWWVCCSTTDLNMGGGTILI